MTDSLDEATVRQWFKFPPQDAEEALERALRLVYLDVWDGEDAALVHDFLRQKGFEIVPSQPVVLDVARLARAICIESESIESDPVDFDVCPDREEHIEYAKAIAAEYAALRQEVGNG